MYSQCAITGSRNLHLANIPQHRYNSLYVSFIAKHFTYKAASESNSFNSVICSLAEILESRKIAKFGSHQIVKERVEAQRKTTFND